MSEAHLSSMALDALALGGRGGSEGTAAAHLQGCEQCRTQLEARRAEHRQVAQMVIPRTMPSTIDRVAARPRLPWRWVAPAMALAAGLVLVVVMRPGPQPEDPELGLKGGPALQVVARHGTRVAPVRSGEVLAAGDELRFVATPAAQRFLLIMSVDRAGAVSVYQPYGGTRSAPLSGERVEIPGSIVLDHAAGPERIVALFSAAPILTSAVEPLLLQLARGGPTALRQAGKLGVPGADEVSLWFEKAAP